MQAAAADAKAKSEAAAEIGLAAGQLKTEVETLAKLLTPAGDSGLPPMLDQIKVAAGYEMALAAALGDDLDAPAAAEAPVHWRLNAATEADPALPEGVEPLVAHVDGPARADAPPAPDRHRRRGRRHPAAAHPEARPAAGLQRGRPVALGRLRRRRQGVGRRRQRAWPSAAGSARSPREEAKVARRPPRPRAPPRRRPAERMRAAQAEEKRPAPALARDAGQAGADARRCSPPWSGRRARRKPRSPAVTDAKGRTQEALVEAHEQLAETEAALQALGGTRLWRPIWRPRRQAAGDLRTRVTESRTELITLEREHRARTERQAAIGARARALEDALRRRRPADRHAEGAHRRGRGRDRQAGRAARHDRAAAPEAHERAGQAPSATARPPPMRWPPPTPPTAQAAQDLRAAQAAVADEREARARAEARLEDARARRSEESAASAISWAARPTAAWRSPGWPTDRRCRGSRRPTASSPASRPTASGWAASTCRPTTT